MKQRWSRVCKDGCLLGTSYGLVICSDIHGGVWKSWLLKLFLFICFIVYQDVDIILAL